MLTILSIVRYPPKAPPTQLDKAGKIKAKRAQWAAMGLCQQHGSERPCGKCAAVTSTWRAGRKRG